MVAVVKTTSNRQADCSTSEEIFAKVLQSYVVLYNTAILYVAEAFNGPVLAFA